MAKRLWSEVPGLCHQSFANTAAILVPGQRLDASVIDPQQAYQPIASISHTALNYSMK